MRIFVETVIRAPIEKLWLHTQDPALHQRWDVRFTRIEYLPKDDDDEPQRFRYVRTLLPGLTVTGLGQTVADRSLPDGSRASSIRFGSADWWSLIREGSGYWRYALTPEGLRFATWYDYRSRWGRLGIVIDRFLFRPLIGWATAWSFDRLRIWLERDIPPTTTLRAAMIHAGARIGLAAVFGFHGLVPKLLWPDPDELLMLQNAGVPAATVGSALLAMGILARRRALGVLASTLADLRLPRIRGGRDARSCAGLARLPAVGVQPGHLERGGRLANDHGSASAARRARRRSVSPPATGGGSVTSIYQRALGSEFDRLHPQIQRRFGFDSTDGVASIGRGLMDEVWRGRFYTVPFLYIGTWRRIMFPETGRNIPFTIENYAFIDDFGRETVTWLRTFESTRRRRFDAYMVYSESRGAIVDYLGSHEHLAVDIELSVDDEGGLRLRSGAQRFYERALGFPFPMLFSGIADVREWFDEGIGRFRISVDVTNRVWGPLFGYRGTFDVEWRPIDGAGIPQRVLPMRQERRD
jgi:Domain of unknown function (DUF4166)